MWQNNESKRIHSFLFPRLKPFFLNYTPLKFEGYFIIIFFFFCRISIMYIQYYSCFLNGPFGLYFFFTIYIIQYFDYGLKNQNCRKNIWSLKEEIIIVAELFLFDLFIYFFYLKRILIVKFRFFSKRKLKIVLKLFVLHVFLILFLKKLKNKKKINSKY